MLLREWRTPLNTDKIASRGTKLGHNWQFKDISNVFKPRHDNCPALDWIQVPTTRPSKKPKFCRTILRFCFRIIIQAKYKLLTLVRNILRYLNKLQCIRVLDMIVYLCFLISTKISPKKLKIKKVTHKLLKQAYILICQTKVRHPATTSTYQFHTKQLHHTKYYCNVCILNQAQAVFKSII